MKDLDLRFIERDGKMILQWRKNIDGYKAITIGELLPNSSGGGGGGGGMECMTKIYTSWQDIRTEKEVELG